MSRRVQRVGEQLKREISQVLRTQVHDPRVSGVTVTGVEVSPDLTFARVWVQLSGDDERRRTALEGLSAAAPFVRRQLGSVLRVRRIPELDFQRDQTLERALRIEALLREVTPGEERSQTEGADESSPVDQSEADQE
jgi:ribosome-binding factor A